MSDVYIFGYGSLISQESRARTGITGEAIPVIVSGAERGWVHPAPSMGITALGVTYSSGSKGLCNGVIFSVDERQLPEFDRRETGYTRIAMPRVNIGPINPRAHLPPGAIWTYSINNPEIPKETLPIAQSYLDVVLLGCINEGGERFALAFVTLTAGWNAPWVNDRESPRYTRHLDYGSPDV
ncbi:gamma-glutamylcyclotransferase, partial [Candidatus Woesearchaeota archaeon]|nr:gamma-glutamylcyclotransferase [Candidatus Woesearchaeota archaeon]